MEMENHMRLLSQEALKLRNNIKILGSGSQTLVLAHGFGCDQNMWRFLLPSLVENYTVILFDYVGSGRSDLAAFDRDRYATLEGYAQDVVDICEGFDLHEVHFIGHSVSSMIGMLAALKAPERFASLIMVCPSPCFLNIPPDYKGGFDKADLEELIDLMDQNYIGWANYLAPLVMGEIEDTMLVGELADSFCSTDPIMAKTFARATFFSDYRHLLTDLHLPTLILQSETDSLASVEIGQYMHQKIVNSELQLVDTKGHCIHMTHPDVVLKHSHRFISKRE